MMFWDDGYSGSMILWMFLGNIFWLVLLGLLAWTLFQWAKRQLTTSTPRDTFHAPSATEILRQRYARGEIDAETFEGMLAHLNKRTEQQTNSS